jgi:hypothetical protein
MSKHHDCILHPIILVPYGQLLSNGQNYYIHCPETLCLLPITYKEDNRTRNTGDPIPKINQLSSICLPYK